MLLSPPGVRCALLSTHTQTLQQMVYAEMLQRLVRQSFQINFRSAVPLRTSLFFLDPRICCSKLRQFAQNTHIQNHREEHSRARTFFVLFRPYCEHKFDADPHQTRPRDAGDALRRRRLSAFPGGRLYPPKNVRTFAARHTHGVIFSATAIKRQSFLIENILLRVIK